MYTSQRENETLGNELQSARIELQLRDAEFIQLQADLDAKNDQANDLEDAVAEYETRMEELLSNHQQETEHNVELSEQVAVLKAQLEQGQERAQQSADVSRDLPLEVANVGGHSRATNGVRSSVFDLQEMYAGKVQAMEIVQSDLETQIAQLQHEKEEALRGLQSLQAERDEVAQKLSALTEQLAEAKEQLENVQHSLALEEKVRQGIEETAADLKQQLSTAHQTVKQHTQCHDTIETLEEQLQQTKELVAHYDQQLQDTDAVRDYSMSLEVKVQSMTLMIEQLQQEKHDLGSELESTRQNAQLADTLVIGLRSQVTEAEHQIAAKSAELESVLQTCSSLEEKLDAERTRARELVEDLRQGQAQSDGEIERLQSHLRELEKQASSAHEDIADRQREGELMASLVQELRKERDLLRIKEQEIDELEREVYMLRVAHPAKSVSDSAHDEDDARSGTTTDDMTDQSQSRTLDSVSQRGLTDEGVSMISELESELRQRQTELSAVQVANQGLAAELALAQRKAGTLADREELIENLQLVIQDLQHELRNLGNTPPLPVPDTSHVHDLEQEVTSLRDRLALTSDYEHKHGRLVRLETELAQCQAIIERTQQRQAAKRMSARRSLSKPTRSRINVPSLDEDALVILFDHNTRDRGCYSPTVDTQFDSDADTEPFVDDESSLGGSAGRFDVAEMSRNPIPELPHPPADLLREHRELQQTCERLEARLATMADYEHKHHQLLRFQTEAAAAASAINTERSTGGTPDATAPASIYAMELDRAQNALAGVADYEYKTVRLMALETEAASARQQAVRLEYLERQVAAMADYEVKHLALLDAQQQLDHVATKPKDTNPKAHVLQREVAIGQATEDTQAQRDHITTVERQLALAGDYEYKHHALLDAQQELSTLRVEAARVPILESQLALAGDYEYKHHALVEAQRELSVLRVEAAQMAVLETQVGSMADYEYKHHALVEAQQELSMLRVHTQRISVLETQIASMADYEYKHRALTQAQKQRQLTSHVASPMHNLPRSRDLVADTSSQAPAHSPKVNEELAALRTANEALRAELGSVAGSQQEPRTLVQAYQPPGVGDVSTVEAQLASVADYEYKHSALLQAQRELATMQLELARLRDHENTAAATADYEHKHLALMEAQQQLAALQLDTHQAPVSALPLTAPRGYVHEDQVSVAPRKLSTNSQHDTLDDELAALRSENSELHLRLAATVDYEHKHGALAESQHELSMLRTTAARVSGLESQLAATVDYEYKHRMLVETQDHPAQAADADKAATLQQSLQSVSALYEQAVTASASMSDYEHKHAHILHIEAKLVQLQLAPQPETASRVEDITHLNDTIESLTAAQRALQQLLSDSQRQLQDSSLQQEEHAAQTMQLMNDLQTLQSMYSQSKLHNAEMEEHLEAAQYREQRMSVSADEQSKLETRVAALQSELDTVLEKNMTLVMQLSEFQ